MTLVISGDSGEITTSAPRRKHNIIEDSEDEEMSDLPSVKTGGQINGFTITMDNSDANSVSSVSSDSSENGGGNSSSDSSDSEGDLPLSVAYKNRTHPGPSRLPAKPASIKSEEDDDSLPLSHFMKREVAEEVRVAVKMDESSSSSSEDAPLSSLIPRRTPQKKVAIQVKEEEEPSSSEDDSDDAPLSAMLGKRKRPIPKAKPTPKAKLTATATATATKVKKEVTVKKEAGKKETKIKKETVKREVKREEGDEDQDEGYKWWLEGSADGEERWKTLSHQGVLFAPIYEPLPLKVKMLYEGKKVILTPEAEEVMGFFAALIETDYAKDPVFVRNFFHDWQAILRASPSNPPITSFDKCDFRPVHAYLEEQREIRRSMSKEAKLKLKGEKEALDAKYGWALLDGRKEKVGNYRIEPPSLFRGRGKHPKTGMLKKRVNPEQVTLNIGEGEPIPPPPPGHRWAAVKHDPKVTWLATWTENINGTTKYVFLGATSSLKGQSDMKKFELARALKGSIEEIRQKYTADLKDTLMEIRQRATALYLIDKLALRAGNEKGEDEADTVGCCSLRCEHVTVDAPTHTVTFDFLGKDSVRFFKSVQVAEQVARNIRLCLKGKTGGEQVFDLLTTGGLNKHLTSLMPGLSAKVFRTYNASITMEEQLRLRTNHAAPLADKILAYNRANRDVAELCNHQRNVGKNHQEVMGKLTNKVKAFRYQRRQIGRKLLQLNPKLRHKHQEIVVDDPELDDAWVREHEDSLVEAMRERLKKTFEKEDAAAVAEGGKRLDKEILKTRLEKAKALKEMYARQRKTGKVELTGSETEAKLLIQLEKAVERVNARENDAIDREENKNTALGTSKLNYIDPRITSAWCKREGVPLEKMFNATLRAKFQWAMDTEADWTF